MPDDVTSTSASTTSNAALAAAAAPVQTDLPIKEKGVQPGIALCLSGGGYRAMLFHLGSLWRLNEAGFLPKLDRVSSVSGGSIAAGVLAMNWNSLDFDADGVARALEAQVVKPLRAFAGETIDAFAVVEGVLLPGTVSDKIRNAYNEHLFHHKTLQDIPDRPRFVFNSTNIQSGALWRFMKPYMRDYRVGCVPNPTVEIAQAVAASSAFPPVLSPAHLKLKMSDYLPHDPQDTAEDLHHEAYMKDVYLSDGGVYDNLGLETAWKRYDTILVSDAGGKMDPEEAPAHDWIRHAIRVFEITDNQVRSLRKRQVIDSYVAKLKNGAYWGIRSDIGAYPLANPLPCPLEATMRLALTPTRLARLEDARQERLINWGYAVCDAALRAHVEKTLPNPRGFPYPATAV